MKRAIVIGLVLMSVVLMVAGPVFAGLGDHAVSATGNHCAECHNVQATATLRGWGRDASLAPTIGWSTRPMTKLCWSCHQATGGGVLAHDVTATAMALNFDTGVHMYTPGNVWSVDGLTMEVYSDTGLPYTFGGGSLECTSCHNVHNDAGAPFNNRTNIGASDGLCVQCHKRYNGGPAQLADLNTVGDGFRSLHPTNVAITNDPYNGATTFDSLEARLQVAIPGLAGAGWTLGGHRTTSQEGLVGGVSCQTCHAVHGTYTDSGLGAPMINVEDLLAIPNNYNVVGQPSDLCEGCHGGPAGATIDDPLTVAVEDSVGASGSSDHPIDQIGGRAFHPKAVALPANWTETVNVDNDTAASPFWLDGVSPGPGGSDAPVCSSCHDTHGGITATSLWRSPANQPDGWCFECHSANQVIPDYHHSNRQNDDDGVTFFSALECGDCHGASIGYWKAHNGFWQFAVAPDETVLGGATWDIYQSLCERCHDPADPASTARFIVGTTVTYAFDNWGARHGDASGTESHACSDYGATAYRTDNTTGTFNTWLRGTLPTWPQTTTRSKVGNEGTGDANYANWYMICESCHNILDNCAQTVLAAETLMGGWKVNLTLHAYEDDHAGVAAGEDPKEWIPGNQDSTFCRGCHYTGASQNAPAPGTYVHYPAAHTETGFTYAVGETPYGRTTNTVLTTTTAACPEKSTADADANNDTSNYTAPGVFSYPAENDIDCDSCHRPHNADQDGAAGGFGYVILENGSTTGLPKTDACYQCHDTQVQCQ